MAESREVKLGVGGGVETGGGCCQLPRIIRWCVCRVLCMERFYLYDRG